MSQELSASFRQRLEAASGFCQTADDISQAAAYACRVAVQNGCKSIAAFGWDDAELRLINEACEKDGLALITSNIRNHAAEPFTALTPAQWAAAETGTILVDSADEDLRLATMLGEIHVAVLYEDNIATDMMALTGPMKELMASGPGYLACISGASRTADIERVLTIGVHGPVQLHMVILPGGAS